MRTNRFIALLMLVTVASAAPGKDIPENEFRRQGGGLACITTTFKPELVPPYLPCLRIGPVFIGQPEGEVDRLLGKPWKVMEKGEGTRIKVYPIASREESKPYWVVTFKGGVAEVVQLTGRRPETVYRFSSIALGDSQEQVRALLGAPFSLVPVEEIKGVMWSYRPFPFSLEFVGDKVYSIRVSRTYQ